MQPEINLSLDEQALVTRIRTLLGDQKEVFFEEYPQVYVGPNFSSDGSMYSLKEPKGYPVAVSVSGSPYTVSGYPQVLGYKYLQFPAGTLRPGVQFSVTYEHFNFSDKQIIDAYDHSSSVFLKPALSSVSTDYPVELLCLSTAYLMLQDQLAQYIEGAVSIQDADSQYDSTARAEILRKHLEDLGKKIDAHYDKVISTAMLNMAPRRVE